MGIKQSSIVIEPSTSKINNQLDYIYLISQQTSNSILYEDGYNGLNTWGIYTNYIEACENACKLSKMYANFNVFLHKLKCGFWESMDLSNLDEYYPIHKWRNGDIVNDSDIQSQDDNFIDSCDLNQFVTDYLSVNIEELPEDDIQIIE